MITEELKEFSREFHDEIRAQAHAADAMKEEVFVERMGDILEEYGEIEGFNPCSYIGKAGKIDGWYFDDEFKDIVVIVSKYFDSDNLEEITVTNSEVNALFTQAERFIFNSIKGLHKKIDISDPAHELSSLIADCGKELRNIKIVLITDGLTKRREAEVSTVDDIEISKTIWDIERTYNFYRKGEREVIGVNFAEDYGGPINCVSLKNSTNRYTTYLAFVPGNVLADMYAKWGTKMLDMNVRVFLSARGNVNKGIKETIQNFPDLFCAYNNGITVFAKEVELKKDGQLLSIVKAHDFQIVNGGQTTASLYHTRKKEKLNLESLYVQMKMTVIHNDADIPLLVPKISEYSNTQNKVQIADLAANQAPHPEIQAISNAIMAPDPTGGSVQTYWFYERARGGYEESKNLFAKTSAQKRQFDSLRPKNQKFDKIKFAKVWNTFLRLPHLVSLGGQKNFGRFNEWLREQHEDWTEFFKKTVALLILWNNAEKIVRRQGFEGYHHNIIAYTLSWFFQLTGNRIDLNKIWKSQDVPASILDTLEQMSSIVNSHIRDTSQNVTEYCKKEECWTGLRDKHFSIPDKVIKEYVAAGENKHYVPSVTSETEAIQFCKDKGADSWFALSKWLKELNYLTPKARSQSFNMGRCLKRANEPSTALSIPCKKIWAEAENRGWPPNIVPESGSPR